MATDDNLAGCIVKKLGQLWEDDELSDINIVIDDIQFNCHRFHLSACSEFFRVLLKSQTMKASSDVIAVTIKGLAPETFNAILLSVYKGELTVTTDNMLDLWHASHHLQIDFLVNKLEHFISRNITDDNFFINYKMAVELTSDRIIKSIQSFIAQNFEKISKTEDFLNLSYNCLLSVIGHDDLVLKSRDHLVSSVLYWMDYKPRSMDSTGRFQEGKCANLNEKKLVDKAQMLHATKYKHTRKGIDVIFQSVDELTHKVESSSQRKDNLGELMKLINLDDVSQDCLLTLLNNDDTIECREARTIVRQAFADRKDKTSLVKENTDTKSSSFSTVSDSSSEHHQCDAPEVVEDTVPVVVYLQLSFKAILAYVLNTQKTYSLPRNGLPKDGSTKNVYSYKNQLYLLIGQSLEGKDVRSIYKLQPTCQWECLTEVPDGSHSFMFNDNYIYCIVKYKVCRLNMECVDCLVWIVLYYIYDGTYEQTFVMFGKTLLYQTDKTLSIATHPNIKKIMGFRNKECPSECNMIVMGYVDLNLWKSGNNDEWISKKYIPVFYVQPYDGEEFHTSPSGDIYEHMHLLTQEGQLLHVTHPSDTSLKVTPEEKVFANDKVTLLPVGTVRYKNILYVFINQGVCEPSTLKLTSFNEIRIAPLLYAESNCVPLKAPKRWLNREI